MPVTRRAPVPVKVALTSPSGVPVTEIVAVVPVNVGAATVPVVVPVTEIVAVVPVNEPV